MSEEPKEVLKEERVAAAGGVKEGGSEVAVGEEHGNSASEDGQNEYEDDGGKEFAPHEEGILKSDMPGARILSMVVMKLMAPSIDEAPAR